MALRRIREKKNIRHNFQKNSWPVLFWFFLVRSGLSSIAGHSPDLSSSVKPFAELASFRHFRPVFLTGSTEFFRAFSHSNYNESTQSLYGLYGRRRCCLYYSSHVCVCVRANVNSCKQLISVRVDNAALPFHALLPAVSGQNLHTLIFC